MTENKIEKIIYQWPVKFGRPKTRARIFAYLTGRAKRSMEEVFGELLFLLSESGFTRL